MNKSKGLTLIELLTVIIVLGILSIIVFPNIKNIANDARKATLENDISTYSQVVSRYHLNNEEYPVLNPLELKDATSRIDSSKLNGYLNKESSYDSNNSGDYYFSVDYNGDISVTEEESLKTLDWLKNTDLIADSFSDAATLSANGANGVPNGLVLWNYDKDNGQFNNGLTAKGTILSVNTTLRSLLDAYEYTGDVAFLNRAEEVGGYINNNIITGTVYGKSYPFLVTQREFSSSWVANYDEVYIQDIAMSATNLYRLYEKTSNSTYLTNANSLMVTLNESQDLVHSGTLSQGGSNPDVLSGGLFWMYSHSGGNVFAPTWVIYGLDNIDMIVDAYTKAYDVTEDADYKRRLDWYSDFIISIMVSEGGINPQGYPYEYYANRGSGWKAQNSDQLNGSAWGENEAFTTDQFFYSAIGVAKIDKNLGMELLKTADNMHSNYLFNGQYEVDGTPNISEYETINTGMYLELSKILGRNVDSLDVGDVLIEYVSDDAPSNNNSYGAYEWATNTVDNIIESIATSRIISSLLR